MRRNPQFKNVTLSEAAKMFEESLLHTVCITRTDRKRMRLNLEQSPHTNQFGGYADTETSHKFRAYCEALVRVGFMDAKEIA